MAVKFRPWDCKVVWALALAVFVLGGCREQEVVEYSRFVDRDLVVILEQQGDAANKTTEWLKSALKQKGREFLLLRKEELEEFYAAENWLLLPVLVVPDATRIESDILPGLKEHIDRGARVMLIGERSFDEIGKWQHGVWHQAVEAAAESDDFCMRLVDVEGSWGGFKSGRVMPKTVKEWIFANGGFLKSEASLGLRIEGRSGGEGALEVVDEFGNRWRREFTEDSFEGGEGVFWWDEFVLVDRISENFPDISSLRKFVLGAVSDGELEFGNLKLIKWKNGELVGFRPEIPGISPGLQRVAIDTVQEFLLLTGSRVPSRQVEKRILACPTLQGRSAKLAANWRQISLIDARENVTGAAAPIASVVLRADCKDGDECVRQRVAWFSMDAEELSVLRLEAMWSETLHEALQTLGQSFCIIGIGTNGPTLMANEVPVLRIRYAFSEHDADLFPRLDVEVYPVGRTAPIYRGITQRVVEPGVIEVQMPSTISPGEYEVSVKFGLSQSTHITTFLQVEQRTFPRVERIEFNRGQIFRDGSVWVNRGLQYTPSYIGRVHLLQNPQESWLSENWYDPVQVEEDLALLAKREVDSVRVDVRGLDSAAALRDFLLRALKHKIFVRVNLSPLFSSGRGINEIEGFIKNAKLDEHRIAWFWDILDNPAFGNEAARQNLSRSWELWLAQYYGNADKLHEMLSGADAAWVKTRATPPDDFLANNGDWNAGVQVYRAFLSDMAYGIGGELVRHAQRMRAFGSLGVRTGWQGSLSTQNLYLAPWWSGESGMNFQTVSIGMDNLLDSDFDPASILIVSGLAARNIKPNSVLFFDGLGGDELVALPWMNASQRKELFESFLEMRKNHPLGAWWAGNAFEGYDGNGRWKSGFFNSFGMPKESWLAWRERITVAQRPVGRRAVEAPQNGEATLAQLDLESDARGPVGVILNYISENDVELSHSGVRVEIGPENEKANFARVAGLPAGRLRYVSAHMVGLKIMDARGAEEPAFSRAGVTVSLAKGDVTLTLTLENNGAVDWVMRSREEALLLKNMENGEVVAKLDRTVRQGERADVSVRTNAERLVSSVRSTYGLYWDENLIYVTPEIRWTATRDWR